MEAPVFTRRGWRAQPPEARRLIAVRATRSVAQGALAVDFVLYLKAIHWTGPAIGALLSVQGLAGAALMMAIGPLSDRVGQRRPLLAYEALTALGALSLLLTARPWVLVAVALALGLGRGANGSAGPFAPAEQAWIANVTDPGIRPQVFSLASAAAFWGMGVGAFLAGALALLFGGRGYLPVFGLACATAAVNVLQIARIPEARGVPAGTAAGPPVPVRNEGEIRKRENGALWRLVLVNAVNAVGVGLMGPLLPYWFALRYGAGPSAIGPLYALTFIATGLASLATGDLAARLGVVRTIVRVRALGILFLAALPFMPSFPLAAAVYLLRSVVNRGAAGVRQAFGVGLVRGTRRGLAASLQSLSMRVPSAVGPVVSGSFFATGDLVLPLVLAAAFQAAYVVLFNRVFPRYERAHEAAEA